MLSISHALTGAFIASKIQNPIMYLPLVLASHYLEDWILHWDVGTGLSNGSRKKNTALLLEIGDLVITAVLILWFFQYGRTELAIHAYIGSFVGLLPDFLEAPKNFLNWNPWFLKPFNDFHHHFHHSTPNMILGLAPQAAVIVVIFLLK